jgi:predicted RNA-binding Zn ribbon-like protein
LRSEIWSISEALRAGGSANLKVINALLAQSPPQPQLARAGEAFVHNLPGEHLREPLWPILWSLSSVLTSADAKRIGCCQAQGCGWFYVDESPNKSRLWCSSEVCGNRERARRAYAKRRSV